MNWTPVHVSALIALWNDGLPCREIGRRLGFTKNAIIGKANRMGLPKRSPSVRKAVNDKKPPGAEVISLEQLTFGMCSWPHGDPQKDEFHFCGQPAVEGKPYCAEHCARAYVISTKEARTSASHQPATAALARPASMGGVNLLRHRG
ncbi:MAG TPA: GcrA family cell cycle regulator [Rhodospirillales bacterium]|nr:GcrA family cell cycle regulator [Rhodospirillales bacterium]